MTKNLNEGFNLVQLRVYQELHALTSLFIDPDNPDDFVAGYIECMNSKHLVLRSVSPFGRYDGFILVRLADVSMAIGEDDYAERLRRLLYFRGEQPTGDFDVEAEEDYVHAFCRNAQRDNRVVTLWTADAEYIGRVERLDDMRVALRRYDFFAETATTEIIPLRSVEEASYGSEDDRLYEVLSDGAVHLCEDQNQ